MKNCYIHLASLLAIASFCSLPQSEAERVVSVCKIANHIEAYDGKEVYVDAFVMASQHAVLLTEPTCGKGIYITFPSDRKEAIWKSFYEAIFSEEGGIEKRPLHVRLKGIFHSHVQHGDETIRQISVQNIVEVSFH